MWFVFLLFTFIGLIVYNIKENYYKYNSRSKAEHNKRPTYSDSRGNNYLTHNGKKVIYTTEPNGDWVLKDAKTLETVFNFSNHSKHRQRKEEDVYDCSGQFKLIKRDRTMFFPYVITCFDYMVLEQHYCYGTRNEFYTNIENGKTYHNYSMYLGASCNKPRQVALRTHGNFKIAYLYCISEPEVICYAPKGVGNWNSNIMLAKKSGCNMTIEDGELEKNFNSHKTFNCSWKTFEALQCYEDIDIKAIKLLETFLNKLLEIHKEKKYLYEKSPIDIHLEKNGFPTHRNLKECDYIHDGLAIISFIDSDYTYGYDDTIIKEMKKKYENKFVRLFDAKYDYKYTCFQDRINQGSLIKCNERPWLERFNNYYSKLKTEIESINVKEIASKLK